MKKANTSDITQFTLIFPSTSTSCMCGTVSLAFADCSLFNPLVWIIFWFTLSAGSLVGFSFLGQTLWKVGFLCFFFLPSSHQSYHDSSILSKCTRKPVCSLCFLYSLTGTLTSVYSSSWIPPDLKTPRVSPDHFTSLPLSCTRHHHPSPITSTHLTIVYFLSWVMEYQNIFRRWMGGQLLVQVDSR